MLLSVRVRIVVTDIRTAEMTKIVHENTFRAVNIAFVTSFHVSVDTTIWMFTKS